MILCISPVTDIDDKSSANTPVVHILAHSVSEVTLQRKQGVGSITDIIRGVTQCSGGCEYTQTAGHTQSEDNANVFLRKQSAVSVFNQARVHQLTREAFNKLTPWLFGRGYNGPVHHSRVCLISTPGMEVWQWQEVQGGNLRDYIFCKCLQKWYGTWIVFF